MEIKNLYQPFEVEYFEASRYIAAEHKNTFFEMVFILEGEGIQSINQHKLPYGRDKLFLIFPRDRHGFEVTVVTRFLFIRFNDSYLKTQSKEWLQKLEFIFHNHNHLPGCILKTMSDKPLIRAMAEALMVEHQNNHPHQQEVIRQIINTMITIAARNISLMPPAIQVAGNDDGIVQLLGYIHQHIYEPELLRAIQLAGHFNIAATYIGEYFKTKTGIHLQQYITTYKMKLVETRLRYSSMQVNEIVDEFGFTDASHLNKLFKKHSGLSPTAYRDAILAGGII